MKYDFFCHQISIVQMKFVIIQNFPSAKIHTNSNIFRNPEHISADISTLVLLPRSYEQSHRLFSLIRNTDNQHVSAALEVWRASVIQTSTELYYHSLPLGDSFTFHASETKLQHSPLIYIYQRLALKIKNNIFIYSFKIQSTSHTTLWYCYEVFLSIWSSIHFLLYGKGQVTHQISKFKVRSLNKGLV